MTYGASRERQSLYTEASSREVVPGGKQKVAWGKLEMDGVCGKKKTVTHHIVYGGYPGGFFRQGAYEYKVCIQCGKYATRKVRKTDYV